MKKNVLTLCCVCLSVLSFAQMQKPVFRPDWMIKTPRPENATFLYVVEHGEGLTQREALNQAIGRVFQSTANRIGQVVSTDEINRAVQAGTDYNVIARNLKVPINKVCEWPKQLEDNTWIVYILCQVAKTGNITPEFVPFTECLAHEEFDVIMKRYNDMLQQQDLAKKRVVQKENGIALLESIFVPGLGQMLKGYYVEGSLMLAGELALIGGGIGTYCAAQNKLEIMKDKSGTYESFITARQQYNGLRAANYTLYGVTIALHAFNMYRAYTLKSKKSTYAFNPTIIPMEEDKSAYGVCLTVNF